MTKSYVYKSWRKQTPINFQPYTLVGGLPGVDSKQLTLGMRCRAAEGLEAKGDQGEGNLWWDVEILWIDQLSGTCPSCPKIWLVWNNVTRYQTYSRDLLQYLNSHWNSFHFEFFCFLAVCFYITGSIITKLPPARGEACCQRKEIDPMGWYQF